jgi:elongation factor 1-alpha
LKECSVRDFERGLVLSDYFNDPVQTTTKFIARITVINHPTLIKCGYIPVLDIHTAHVPCKLSRIIALVDPKTGKSIHDNPESIKSGDSALVELTPLKPVVIETFE